MTSRPTNFRLASAAVAGVAVVATSVAALTLPGLAQADQPAVGASASPTANAPASATTRPQATEPGAAASPTQKPQVETTNAPGSDVSFGPAQEWSVLDPRFSTSELKLLTGETFTMYVDALHSQPLEQDVTLELSELVNLTCTPEEDTVPAGSLAGLETWTVECEITKGRSVISGVYELVQADGSPVAEGIFGATPGETPGNATASPGGSSETSEETASATPTASGSGSVPTSQAPAPQAQIEIATARFTPAQFVARTGQEFMVEKDVTITEAPLASDLTMSIDRLQNLVCDPSSDSIAAGAEGTHTLTFACTISGVDRAPGAWYSIALADGTVLVEDAYFGLGDGGSFSEESDSGEGSISEAGTTGAGSEASLNTGAGTLANTGGPVLGFLGAGAALLGLGTYLLRRRGA